MIHSLYIRRVRHLMHVLGKFNNLFDLNFAFFLAYFIVCHTMDKNTFSKLLRPN